MPTIRLSLFEEFNRGLALVSYHSTEVLISTLFVPFIKGRDLFVSCGEL